MGNVLSLAAFRDGIANLYSKLGTSGDRATQSTYWVPTLNQQQIEAAHRSSWLTRKVHDLPPFEMTRAGRAWQAEKEQIEKLEAAETALGIWPKLFHALLTARLHGGAAIIMGVRQGMPNQELRPDTITANALRYVFVCSRHQLTAPHGFETDLESDYFGGPAMWQIRGAKGNTVDIHPSRVLTFHGAPLPAGAASTSQIDQFWGDPYLLAIKSAIDNAETAQAAIATLLHEMKQDVISIPGLTEQIATDGAEGKLAARIQALNTFRSMFNALLLDRGDSVNEASGEKWETRQLSFAQHPELIRAFLGVVAGAADIPVTRLMGESPGGMQSTGKGEQEDFNRMIDNRRTAELGPPLARLDEVLIRSVLGSRPPEIYYEFGALAEADPGEAATNEKTEAETIQIYSNTGLIPAPALAKAAANRLIESGRFPGLDKAIEEGDEELGEGAQPGADVDLPEAANENDVQEMERRRTITRDQAITLLADASPRSLYVSRAVENGSEIRAWARKAGLEITVPDDKLHVTVMSSRTPVDWMKMGSGWEGDEEGRIIVAPGGPRMIEPLGGGIVLMFYSPTLIWRHEDMKRAGAEFEHGEFMPHVTLAYDAPQSLNLRDVEPYRGRIVLGPERFEEFVEAWRP